LRNLWRLNNAPRLVKRAQGNILLGLIRFDRPFGDQPTNDPAVRLGRIIGNIIEIALYPALA
jgi:hypothetical protein